LIAVKLQGSTPREAAMRDEHSSRARPWASTSGYSSPRSSYAHNLSEQRVELERGVRAGHRITARDETVIGPPHQKTMQKETVLPKREDDLSASNIVERAGCDLRYIVWPERGQHAFATNSQAQSSGPAQSLDG
jgi:hypothetical protein